MKLLFLKTFSFLSLLAILILTQGNNTLYSQGEVCKIVFCNCCADSTAYNIYDVSGNWFGEFIIPSSGCQSIENWVNITPGGHYYAQPQNDCGGVDRRTYFTACVCTDEGQWVDTVIVRCCPEGDQFNFNNNNSNVIQPGKFSLLQNFPNPFNPVTKIEFNVPVESYVQLSIYNVNGEKIQTLISELKSTGRYEVFWDAKNYASGVYFYKLEAGSFVDSKKMMLVK